MANRTFTNQQSLEKGLVCITGSFAPNGSSALVAANTKGSGFTVARSGAGSFTITLTDAFVSLIGASFVIAVSAVADLKPQLGAVDVVTAKTVVVNVLAVATPTDIAANAANRIYFSLWLKNSTV